MTNPKAVHGKKVNEAIAIIGIFSIGMGPSICLKPDLSSPIGAFMSPMTELYYVTGYYW